MQPATMAIRRQKSWIDKNVIENKMMNIQLKQVD